MARDGAFSFSDANKLEAAGDHLVWKVRMQAIFRRERLWDHVVCPNESLLTMDFSDPPDVATVAATSNKQFKNEGMEVLIMGGSPSAKHCVCVRYTTIFSGGFFFGHNL